MFGYTIDLHPLVARFREALTPHWRGLAGVVFVALALVAIEYDEYLAPSVGRMSDAWSTVATDLGRKLSAFSL